MEVGATIFALFGFRKSFREGYVVKVFVDDRELNGSSEGSQFVSNPAHRGRESWWAVNLELPHGAVIKLETKVGVAGKGPKPRNLELEQRKMSFV